MARSVAARSAGSPGALVEIPLASRPFELLVEDVGDRAWKRLQAARADCVAVVAGRTIWSVNSTATGGGVAEMQRTLLPYWRSDGLDVRWLVLTAAQAFFRVTKRLHNMLHGTGPERPLGLRALRLYEDVSRTAAGTAGHRIAAEDVVILHDPQTAGLIPFFRQRGAIVIWRCHIGTDARTASVAQAWRFLLPYVALADRTVFTRPEFVPAGLDRSRVQISAPAIDPRSPKNQPLDAETADAILHYCGIASSADQAKPGTVAARTVDLAWGGRLRVHRRCGVLRQDRRARLGEDQLVVALSRWDRLKDPVGMLAAFAEHVDHPSARLVLAGPPPVTVTDDPEGAAVLREVRAAWRALPLEARRRIDVAVVPMADIDENGLIVNALQRRASVIVKKSLQEGFGLGVTEALWKTRPVIATNVGGHRAQIEHRKSGLLVDDPTNLATFGAAITGLLANPAEALSLGLAGHSRVHDQFLADSHYADWSGILCDVINSRPRNRPHSTLAATHPLSRPERELTTQRPVATGISKKANAERLAAEWPDHRQATLSMLAHHAKQRAAAARERAAASDNRAREHQATGADRPAAIEHRAAQLHRQAAHVHENAARHFEELMQAAPDATV
jgi:trehalose synthase